LAVRVFVDALRLTSISLPYPCASSIDILPGIPHPLTHTQAPRVVLCCHRSCTATDQPMPPWRRPLLCPSLMTCPRLCSRLPSSHTLPSFALHCSCLGSCSCRHRCSGKERRSCLLSGPPVISCMSRSRALLFSHLTLCLRTLTLPPSRCVSLLHAVLVWLHRNLPMYHEQARLLAPPPKPALLKTEPDPAPESTPIPTPSTAAPLPEQPSDRPLTVSVQSGLDPRIPATEPSPSTPVVEERKKISLQDYLKRRAAPAPTPCTHPTPMDTTPAPPSSTQ
jgi:hypothetical protein